MHASQKFDGDTETTRAEFLACIHKAGRFEVYHFVAKKVTLDCGVLSRGILKLQGRGKRKMCHTF